MSYRDTEPPDTEPRSLTGDPIEERTDPRASLGQFQNQSMADELRTILHNVISDELGKFQAVAQRIASDQVSIRVAYGQRLETLERQMVVLWGERSQLTEIRQRLDEIAAAISAKPSATVLEEVERRVGAVESRLSEVEGKQA